MFGVLDIVLILIFVGSILLALLQGFAKSVAGAVRFGGALLLAKIFSPILGGFFHEHWIGPRVRSWLEEKLSQVLAEVGESVTFDQLFAEGNSFSSALAQLGDAEEIEALQEKFHDGVSVTKETVGEMVGSVSDACSMRFSVILAAVLIFIISFVLLVLLTTLLIAVVKRVSLLKKVDRTLGALFGIVLGASNIVSLCVLCHLIAGMIVLFGGSSESLLEPINASMLAGPIYRFSVELFLG